MRPYGSVAKFSLSFEGLVGNKPLMRPDKTGRLNQYLPMKPALRLLLVLATLAFTAGQASAVPGHAEVKRIVGTATVSKATGGAPATLAEGMVLGTGDTINTGPSSAVDLNLGVNGDVLRVEPDSTLSLDQLDVTRISPPVVSTKLNVTKGGVTANVITKLAAASRYEVRTPNGVAGIRGTIYNASVGTGMSVLHGTVSWTPMGGVVVTLSMGQSANEFSAPVAIGQTILQQAISSVSASTGATYPRQVANTVNTLAQSVATTAAIAVLAGGGTQAQAAAAAASAAQEVTRQVVAALSGANMGIAAVVARGAAQTAVAAAAIGAATAVAASGGTVAQAQAAGAIAAGTAATATGGTVTAAITAVSNTAATTTATAVLGGATGLAAASASVTSSAVTTTQIVATSEGTGQGAGTTVTQNPADVSTSGR